MPPPDGFVNAIPFNRIPTISGERWEKVTMRAQKLNSWLILCALSCVTEAFAANSGSLHVPSAEDVAGQHLGVGNYTVRWEGNGPDVELKIMQGRKVAATAVAHVKPLQNASPNDAALINTASGRKRTLSQIFFAGKKVVLEIPAASEQTSISGGH